ncbi:MAG: hypothetical protein WCD18_11205, partial [Thermosynechococcaceae cyanobacterium]
MSAHVSTSQVSAPQEPISHPFPKGILWGGGVSLLALGFVIDHLPGPMAMLGWVGVSGAILWGARRLWNARSPQTEPQPPRFLTPARVQQALA